MKIRKEKKNILINTKEAKILLLIDEKTKVKTEDYNVVINTTSNEYEPNHVISTPGEFEVSDVLFSVYNADNELDKPGVVVVDTDENIKFVFVSSDVAKLNKSVLETLADTDIMLIETDNNSITKQLEMLNEVEPQIFLPISDNGKLEEIDKAFGSGVVEEIGVLKISQSDFTEESADTKVYYLK